MEGPPDPVTPSRPAAPAGGSSANGVGGFGAGPSGSGPSTSTPLSCPSASTQQQTGHTRDAADAGEDCPSAIDDGGDVNDDLSLQFKRLSAAMDARMRLLSQQEEQVKQAEAALSRASSRMAALSARTQSDIISLNVGGTHLASSRRTLTLVPDSLLGTMFSGSWDDHLQRDETGRVFLDYDPALFRRLLNWLRAHDMGGPDAPLCELEVEAGREEQLLVLIDFLQMQRHVPCRFPESFSPALSSPFLSLNGGCAWRTAAGGQGAYAMAATTHCCFDVDVSLSLEVAKFGAVGRTPSATSASAATSRPGDNAGRGSSEGDAGGDDPLLPNHPMFIGVITKGQLAAMDQTRKKSNASWQSTCHGWWTSRRHGCEVRGGKSKQLQTQLLWSQGDLLVLSLDAAKHPSRLASQQGGPGLTLVNTRTTAQLHLDISLDCLGEFEEQWVAVVGLAGRDDMVWIRAARRRGMKPAREGEMPASTGAATKAGGSGPGAAAGAGAGAPGEATASAKRGRRSRRVVELPDVVVI